MEFHSTVPPLDLSPLGNLTIPQFMLDTTPEVDSLGLRPARDTTSGTWFVEDQTGKRYDLETVKERVYGLANALAGTWGVRDGDVVCLFSPNHIDYPIAVWAVQRLCAAVSPANPSYTVDELIYQIQASGAKSLLTCLASLPTALAAAEKTGIPRTRVAVFDLPIPPNVPPRDAKRVPFATVGELIHTGLTSPPAFEERRLSRGEAARKPAFLCFSSGTTGRPKAVAISHYSVTTNVIQYASFNHNPAVPREKQRFRPGDVSLGVLPFYHIYAMVVLLHATTFLGQAVVVVSKFDFNGFLSSIHKYSITHISIVPPMAMLMCKHPASSRAKYKNIRYCMVGGAPVSTELATQLNAILPDDATVGQGYGLTESSTVITMLPLGHLKGVPGSAGKLITNCTARVVKPDGSLGGIGEEGELVVKSPATPLNYYLGNVQANRETFVNGWLKTGDEVYFDKDGNLFIVDRLKEIFKVRGFQVAPAELEGFLLGHEAVADVGVVGIPDPYSQDVPAAFVVLSAKFAAAAKRDPKEGERIKENIAQYVALGKTRYKWLDGGVHFIDAVPKNPSGKILRRVLRGVVKEKGLVGPGKTRIDNGSKL